MGNKRERMKQQIREAADLLVRFLTVPTEAGPDQLPDQHHEHQQADDAEADFDPPIIVLDVQDQGIPPSALNHR
jgi:hypothetical protein